MSYLHTNFDTTHAQAERAIFEERLEGAAALFHGAIDLPFVEGMPSREQSKAMAAWLKANSDKYDNRYTVLYHGTGPTVPVEKEGLKPTSAARRRSYQSTSGYVYLANTPERAAAFGSIGNGGKCRVYAVRVPVRYLKADLDQLYNQRSVGADVQDTLADSIVYGGGARFKGAISAYDVREVKRNPDDVYVAAEVADRENAAHALHKEQLESTGFWGAKGAGCLFLARSTGRFLIAHRSEDVLEPGTWGTWGGAIDSGLSVLEAVEEEVRQEAGFTGECAIVPLAVFAHASGFEYHNHLVIVDDEFNPKLNWESQGARWVTLDKLPAPLHPGVEYLLENSGDEMRAIAADCLDTHQLETNALNARGFLDSQTSRGRKPVRP